jgi:branched-chain amino acid transport system ATP-binding protein
MMVAGTSSAFPDIQAESPSLVSLLRVGQLCAGYAGFTVVRDIDVDIRPGGILTLVGPNGSGKSTFAKSVLGLVAKYGGRVHFDGDEITELATHDIVRRGVGYIPQAEDVFPSLSVLENLEIPCLRHGRHAKDAANHIFDVLPSLYDLRKRRASHLSGGERRLVSVGKALVASPRLLIADEPSANLAPPMAARVWQELRRIADSGIAILAVEQNVGLALEFSDEISVLVEGSLCERGLPARSLSLADVFGFFVGKS